jgi:hypothetical protein
MQCRRGALQPLSACRISIVRSRLDRTKERFGIWPERLAPDTGYGPAVDLA